MFVVCSVLLHSTVGKNVWLFCAYKIITKVSQKIRRKTSFLRWNWEIVKSYHRLFEIVTNYSRGANIVKLSIVVYVVWLNKKYIKQISPRLHNMKHVVCMCVCKTSKRYFLEPPSDKKWRKNIFCVFLRFRNKNVDII